MSFCRNCPHFSYEHEDVALGEPCLATFGAWSDWPQELDADRCLCPGFEPEPIGADL